MGPPPPPSSSSSLSSPLPGKAGEQLNHPHREGDILAWQGAEEAHQDREQIHEIIAIANAIVGVRCCQDLGELVGLHMSLAVLSSVAKVVDEHRRSALKGVYLGC